MGFPPCSGGLDWETGWDAMGVYSLAVLMLGVLGALLADDVSNRKIRHYTVNFVGSS